jgi:hypothetical protein
LDFINHTLCQEDKKLTEKLRTELLDLLGQSQWRSAIITQGCQLQCNQLTIKSNNQKVVKDFPTLSWAKEALNPLKWKGKKTKYIRPKQNKTKQNKTKQKEGQKNKHHIRGPTNENGKLEPKRDPELQIEARTRTIPMYPSDYCPSPNKPDSALKPASHQ